MQTEATNRKAGSGGRTKDIFSQSGEGERGWHGVWIKEVAKKNEDSAKKQGSQGLNSQAFFFGSWPLAGQENFLKVTSPGVRTLTYFQSQP